MTWNLKHLPLQSPNISSLLLEKKNEDSFIYIQDDVTLVINIHLLGHLISNESAYHHYYLVPVIPSV